ncbi:tyrosinase central domain containing protein [Colletotrichum musicola]|uniref:Tyrosinase central domain containing protein n=2 Tax=Colletotrichum orchidearum species complex TaxID=2707337 RepID=A0A8H6N7U5_9PEZI|nr:tyrosinase central domain containing protein [Colletotrichum musicola]
MLKATKTWESKPLMGEERESNVAWAVHSVKLGAEGLASDDRRGLWWLQLRRPRASRLLVAVLAAVTALTGAGIIAVAFMPGHSIISSGTQQCHNPTLRREWRQLSRSEQQAYISAVQCLERRPSVLVPDQTRNSSRYDDFVLAHGLAGDVAHYAAAFLPWHRMFVQVYETTLRSECGYQGAQPYWDWTLDSASLSAAPVWDAVNGFGGDGAAWLPNTPRIITGRCVEDGPFAGATRAWRVDSQGDKRQTVRDVHCLSRGFASADGDVKPAMLERMHSYVSPAHVEATLAQTDFEGFLRAFENGAHNAIPQFVRGDWMTFSAPNDPVFFLHHTQVDRLWWMWQMRDPVTRFREYHGPTEDFRHHHRRSAGGATDVDVLPMGGLVNDGRVREYLDTRQGSLCYIY